MNLKLGFSFRPRSILVPDLPSTDEHYFRIQHPRKEQLREILSHPFPLRALYLSDSLLTWNLPLLGRGWTRGMPALWERHSYPQGAAWFYPTGHPNQSISISIQHICQMHILYCNRDTMVSVKPPRNFSFLDMLAVALCVSTSQFLFEIFESLGWPSTGYSLPSLVSFRLPWICPFSTLSP